MPAVPLVFVRGVGTNLEVVRPGRGSVGVTPSGDPRGRVSFFTSKHGLGSRGPGGTPPSKPKSSTPPGKRYPCLGILLKKWTHV